MADEEVAKSGKWVDSKTGKVVDKQPEEGIQLVAEGTPITPDVKAAIEAAETAAEGSAPVERTVSTKATEKR